MKKELNTLYNQLKKAGLNSYASKVAAIYKKAGEFEEDMGHDNDEMPKPTLAPLEQPDMNHPVFNSEKRNDTGCEIFTNACLDLMDSKGDMDKFYEAACRFIIGLRKISDHEAIKYVNVPLRDRVESSSNFLGLGRLTGVNPETGKHYEFAQIRNKKELGFSELAQIDGIIEDLAVLENHVLLGLQFGRTLYGDIGADKDCLKSTIIKVIEKSGKGEVSAKINLKQLERECAK